MQGDSRDPLQSYGEDNDGFYVVGVTSSGEEYKPGVYAQTSRFADWLKTSQTVPDRL